MPARASRFLPMLCLALLATGCAGTTPPPAVAPATLADLEAERAKHPDDPALLVRLGEAYLGAGEGAKARDVLRAAQAAGRTDVRTAVLLGGAYEQLGALDSARATYAAAATRASKAERAQLDGRLEVLARKALQADAQAAVAREKALTLAPPTPNTIAVLPWRYLGTNEDLRPLERGLAQLVVTDLAKVQRLRLLERERAQALVDELRLTEAGRTDSVTGARSGRLLGAAQVVQGVVREESQAGRLALQANVVDAKDARVGASAGASDRLERLFDAEKALVLQLLDRLGIQLSPAERRAIAERPTADLQAFLAYSRGLAREDVGDFAGASREYGTAVQRDPGFRAAASRQAAAQQAAAAGALPPVAFAVQFAPPPPGPPTPLLQTGLQAVVPTLAYPVLQRTQLWSPVIRTLLPEVLGTDSPSSLFGDVTITIPRP